MQNFCLSYMIKIINLEKTKIFIESSGDALFLMGALILALILFGLDAKILFHIDFVFAFACILSGFFIHKFKSRVLGCIMIIYSIEELFSYIINGQFNVNDLDWGILVLILFNSILSFYFALKYHDFIGTKFLIKNFIKNIVTIIIFFSTIFLFINIFWLLFLLTQIYEICIIAFVFFGILFFVTPPLLKIKPLTKNNL